MSAQESNKALVRRFYEEIDKGTLAAMDENSLPTTTLDAPPKTQHERGLQASCLHSLTMSALVEAGVADSPRGSSWQPAPAQVAAA